MRFTCGMFALLWGWVLVCCPGCGDSDQPQPKDQQISGRTVAVSFPADYGLEQEWQLSLAEWKERTGAGFELHPRNTSVGDRHSLESYGGSPAAAGDFILLPITGIADFADAGLISRISAERQESPALNWEDFFKGLRKEVCTQYGGSGVVPISCPVLVCYYREDLLAAANLSPPRTWTEYQTLLETTDKWAGGLPGIEPWGVEFRATMFLARAMPYVKDPDEYSTFFDIRSGEPLINRPGFQRALTESLKAVKTMPNEVLTYDTVDCRREFMAGRAAMAIAFETGVGNPLPALVPMRDHDPSDAGPEERPEALQVGFVRLPGSPEVYHHTNGEWRPGKDDGVNRVTLAGFGGLCATVSAQTEPAEAAAAWNLLEYLTADEQLAQTFPPSMRTLCRTSLMSFPEIWIPHDLTAAEGGSYLGEVARSLDQTPVVAELPVVNRESFRAALSEELGRLFLDQVTIEEALDTTAERWRAISEEVGAKKVRDSYRNSLGLRPLSADE